MSVPCKFEKKDHSPPKCGANSAAKKGKPSKLSSPTMAVVAAFAMPASLKQTPCSQATSPLPLLAPPASAATSTTPTPALT